MDVTGEDACLVEADLDGGCMRVDLSLPALITVNRSINEPRIPDVMGIIGVAGKTLSAYGADDIGLPADKTGLAGSPTRVAGVWEVKKDRRSEVLQGNPKHVSSDAVARLRELGGL
jgi:electron transfer flavoprotein beta subunit